LNVLDDFNREGLGIEVDFTPPAEWVVGSLEHIIEWRGKPKTSQVDTGPEYVSGNFLAWDLQQRATQHGHRRHDTRNKTENGRVSSTAEPH
jgi:transposase InsO family protein